MIVNTVVLDACRKFNRGEIDEDKLVALTAAKGFANVIDAFHVVGQADVPQRFFDDERKEHRGIRIRDEFSSLTEGREAQDIPLEVESRWRLVETAWRLGMARSMVVSYEAADGMLLLPDVSLRRKAVTSSRDALNGYQQGRCFYCSGPISLLDEATAAEVDHFFPHRAEAGGIWSHHRWRLESGACLSGMQPRGFGEVSSSAEHPVPGEITYPE